MALRHITAQLPKTRGHTQALPNPEGTRRANLQSIEEKRSPTKCLTQPNFYFLYWSLREKNMKEEKCNNWRLTFAIFLNQGRFITFRISFSSCFYFTPLKLLSFFATTWWPCPNCFRFFSQLSHSFCMTKYTNTKILKTILFNLPQPQQQNSF